MKLSEVEQSQFGGSWDKILVSVVINRFYEGTNVELMLFIKITFMKHTETDTISCDDKLAINVSFTNSD